MSAEPPRYLALDVWMALGMDSQLFDGYMDRNGWGTTWAALMDAVRGPSPKCGADTGDGPCVLRTPRTDAAHIHYPMSDVGRSEPLPLQAT